MGRVFEELDRGRGHRGRAARGVVRAIRAMASGLGAALALPPLLAAAAPSALAATTVEVVGFGSNPGNLRMFKHVPDGLPASAPLVVVLHGCTQDARGYAAASGWVQVAERARAALAMAEQTQANNPNRCFNWFLRGDNRRDQGEALSIRQMVDRMRADHGVDPARVFVTGLSAGGAMASVMLATYPEVFAAGGVVAGLPYGCANDLSPLQPTQATGCMSTGQPSGPPPGRLPGGPFPVPAPPPGLCLFFPLLPGCAPLPDEPPTTASGWGDLVRRASGHAGPFPRVSIWHGSADPVVNPANAGASVLQWTDVHGIGAQPPAQDAVGGHPRRTFRDAAGRAVVESVSVAGMGHGVPVDPGAGADQCGTAGAFVLDADVCSSLFIARFWGILD
jgi:poly(hydroxyalkanoate) depolymerase family esterase